MLSRQEMIDILRDYCSGELNSIFELNDKCTEYMANDADYLRENAQALAIQGMNILALSGISYNIYFLLSFLLKATDNLTIFKTILQYCLVDDEISKEQKFFLYYQLLQYRFVHPHVGDNEVEQLFDQLYTHIFEGYCKSLCIEKKIVPVDKRDNEAIVVLSSQVLEPEHGPTKTLFDRCCVLKNKLGKRVYIINTAEFMSSAQIINYFQIQVPGYVEGYSRVERIAYETDEYPFMQCPKEMPQESIINDIIEKVKAINPYFIVTIGGNSIVSDVCSNYYPTLTVGTVPSGLSTTKGQFQTIGRTINHDDREWLAQHGYTEEHLIESLFTSSFKKQTHAYTREELGLPDGRFIVEVVGARLDDEVDEDFRNLLHPLMEQGIFFAFAGVFKKYEEYAQKDKLFADNSIFLGFQEDMLAVNELCDLYLNPRRIGGGTSVAEALYKGLPAVTFNYGDVGVGAGEAFHVSSYEEAYEQIMRYSKDKEYYTKQSQLAKERAARLMDSDGEFVKVIREMESRKAFL